MVSKMMAVMVIMRTSLANSSRCKDKKRHKRSVSLPTRLMRSPVRLPPK